ncbi:UNVERIFIED_CONTAM: hypothetical protein RMT77_008893 [Armadillidium vulgare]
MWEDKNLIVVGDSRVATLEPSIPEWEPKALRRFQKLGMTTREALKLIDRQLDENVIEYQEPVDIMIMMGLYCDFTWKDTGCRIMIPNITVDISKLILDISKIIDLQETHSYCQVIVTVPYIPDFGRYNHHRLCKKKIEL